MTHILDGSLALTLQFFLGLLGFVVVCAVGLSLTRVSEPSDLLSQDVSFVDFSLVGLVYRQIRNWGYQSLVPVEVRTRTTTVTYHWRR